MPERSYTATTEGYRFGFNGKEQDNSIKGEGNSYDFGARIYDSRLGRFLSTDPLTHSFPFQSAYCFAANQPIWAIDKNGEVKVIVTVTKDDHTYYDENGNPSPKRTVQTVTKDYLIIDELFGVYRSTMNIGVTQIAMNDNDPSTGGTQFNIYSGITGYSGGETTWESMTWYQQGMAYFVLNFSFGVGELVEAAEGKDFVSDKNLSDGGRIIRAGIGVGKMVSFGRWARNKGGKSAMTQLGTLLLSNIVYPEGVKYGTQTLEEKYGLEVLGKLSLALVESGSLDDAIELIDNGDFTFEQIVGYFNISQSKLIEAADVIQAGGRLYKDTEDVIGDVEKEYEF